eukprot:1225467-Rhodomonas_salina.2
MLSGPALGLSCCPLPMPCPVLTSISVRYCPRSIVLPPAYALPGTALGRSCCPPRMRCPVLS